jgi:hypothetical protein
VDPDPHNFGNPDLHLHELIIRICIKYNNQDPHQSDKLGPELDPNLFVDDKLKCVKFDHFFSLFQGS